MRNICCSNNDAKSFIIRSKKFQISTENQKLLLTFPKTAKNKLEDALEDINNNCCEANFQNQAKVEKIKATKKNV